MERLLDLYLGQSLSSDEYREKKNSLMHERRKIQETLDVVAVRLSSWLEPFRRFIKAANDANSVLQSNDLATQGQFFLKVGSNLRLRDRTLHWEPRGAWQLLVDQGVLALKEKAGCGEAAEGNCPNWREVLKRRERDSNPR